MSILLLPPFIRRGLVFFSLTTAAQLAALLIGVIFIVVLFEQYWQAKRGSSLTQGSSQRFDASKPAKLAMTLLCTLIFFNRLLNSFLTAHLLDSTEFSPRF